MRVSRSFLPLVACAAVSALMGAAAVLPATASPAVPTVVADDLDDFRTNPAYAAIYGQKLVWSRKTCVYGRSSATPSARLEQTLRTLSPDAAAPLRDALRDVTPDAAGMECALVIAPKNWADPSQGTLKVGIGRRVQAPNAPRPERLLLSNPGGPGSEGVEFAKEAEKAMRTQGTHLSVGIDPRGVGLSSAAMCEATPMPLPGTESATVAAQVTAIAKQMKNCHAEKGTLLPYIDSVSTARDFNLVRHLLGYERADYLGASYGSWLGAVLGKMFPSRVDRLVLDSNTEWTSGTFRTVFGRNFVAGMQASLERVVYPWIARHHDTYGLGRTGKDVQATILAAEAKAATMGRHGAELMQTAGVMSVMAARQPQESLGMAAYALKSTVTAINEASVPEQPAPETPRQGGGFRENVTTTAIVCNDSGNHGSLANEIARITQLGTQYPLMGKEMAFTTCVDWPRPAAITPELLKRPLRNVLMLQDENDAPTPYQGAFKSRVREGDGVRMLLVDDGHGHIALRFGCAAKAGSEFLTAGTYPKGDVHCQAGPLPSDKPVYEFGFPGSASRPLPQLFVHRPGEVVDPEIDATASAPAPTRAEDDATAVGRRLALRLALTEALQMSDLRR